MCPGTQSDPLSLFLSLFGCCLPYMSADFALTYEQGKLGNRNTNTLYRVDLDLRWHRHVRSPMAEYSEAEARAALARTEATHLRHGW